MGVWTVISLGGGKLGGFGMVIRRLEFENVNEVAFSCLVCLTLLNGVRNGFVVQYY